MFLLDNNQQNAFIKHFIVIKLQNYLLIADQNIKNFKMFQHFPVPVSSLGIIVNNSVILTMMKLELIKFKKCEICDHPQVH